MAGLRPCQFGATLATLALYSLEPILYSAARRRGRSPAAASERGMTAIPIDTLVTVFGGSGFLGRRIVLRLASAGAEVRIAVRHPERAGFLTEARTARPIAAVRADVWDEASVAPAVAGADAVVNTVGHYVERGRASFEAIHGQGARHVAAAAARAGIARLVHISGIGADPRSDSAYVRARGIGERLVAERCPPPRSSARASCSVPRTPS
jgi:NAD(P)H-binding